MQEGQTIKHEMYGLGIVTASDQERTAVDFDDHGAKLFVTSIMTAELIGEAPAVPPKTKRRRKASTAAKAAKKAAASFEYKRFTRSSPSLPQLATESRLPFFKILDRKELLGAKQTSAHLSLVNIAFSDLERVTPKSE